MSTGKDPLNPSNIVSAPHRTGGLDGTTFYRARNETRRHPTRSGSPRAWGRAARCPCRSQQCEHNSDAHPKTEEIGAAWRRLISDDDGGVLHPGDALHMKPLHDTREWRKTGAGRREDGEADEHECADWARVELYL